MPFTKIASDFGSPLVLSSIAIGLICGILNVDTKIIGVQIQKQFSEKGDVVVKKKYRSRCEGAFNR